MSVSETVLHAWCKAPAGDLKGKFKVLSTLGNTNMNVKVLSTHKYKHESPFHTRKYKHERKTEKSYFRSTSKIIFPRNTLRNTTTSFPVAMRPLVS